MRFAVAYQDAVSSPRCPKAIDHTSTSNFTKASTAYFGVSPSRVRRPDPDLPVALGKLTHSYGKRFHPSELHRLPPPEPDAAASDPIEPGRFEYCPGIEVACLASTEGYELATVSATSFGRRRPRALRRRLYLAARSHGETAVVRLDHKPRSYTTSPFFRLFVWLAGVFPGWAERQMAASTRALLDA
jgi:hypothetical protein